MATQKKAVKQSRVNRTLAAKKSAGKMAPAKQIGPKLPRIGAAWAGQGGKFVGLIRGENGQPDYGLVVPTDKSASIKGSYGPYDRLKGAESEYDGMANTRAMAAAGSAIAKQARALNIDGYTDFYIGSHQESRLAYLNAPRLFGAGYHWTSTQSRANDAYAWAQYFDDGNQLSYHKGNKLPVVVLRRVPMR
jgi:hypothetical protein